MPRYETVWSCSYPECGKTFKRKGDAIRHQSLHHRRQFACDLCDKRFAQASALQTHMNVHTGDKPYVCEFDGCTQTFGDPSSRSRHRKEIHTHETFVCLFQGCHFKHKRRSPMLTHLKKVHGMDATPADLHKVGVKAARHYDCTLATLDIAAPPYAPEDDQIYSPSTQGLTGNASYFPGMQAPKPLPCDMFYPMTMSAHQPYPAVDRSQPGGLDYTLRHANCDPTLIEDRRGGPAPACLPYDLSQPGPSTAPQMPWQSAPADYFPYSFELPTIDLPYNGAPAAIDASYPEESYGIDLPANLECYGGAFATLPRPETSLSMLPVAGAQANPKILSQAAQAPHTVPEACRYPTPAPTPPPVDRTAAAVPATQDSNGLYMEETYNKFCKMLGFEGLPSPTLPSPAGGIVCPPEPRAGPSSLPWGQDGVGIPECGEAYPTPASSPTPWGQDGVGIPDCGNAYPTPASSPIPAFDIDILFPSSERAMYAYPSPAATPIPHFNWH